MTNKITIKKFKSFPSMEWGDNGGYSCDIYYENKKQGTFIQHGEGGDFQYSREDQSKMNEDKLNEYCKNFFSCHDNARKFVGYSKNEINTFVDLETMVIYLSSLNSYKKTVNKQIKNGYTDFTLIIEEPKGLAMNKIRMLSSWYALPLHVIEDAAKKHSIEKFSCVQFKTIEQLESLM